MQATPVSADACGKVLTEFIGRLMQGVAQRCLGEMLSSDLTASQFHLLLRLASTDHPLPINRIADELGLSVAATGRNVEKLVQQGLVDRREDANDRRIKNLTVTDMGRKSIAEATADKHREVQALAEELPADVRERLHDVLDEILRLGILSPNPLFTATKVTS